ncbi:TonB-dependent receptor domain-containing protein [Flavobacterium sp. LM4]|uniref:TonB-dependent receptor domain-containing protein n=1 Tax=Flavobacterium sp. LM4 TaxID=1938609 RepID=UPI000994737D|nr:TonB-dependent receptor [Flavobacterium sp. LM4]OOV13182.1 TonB-dependent receptor [Flavobacterium sp. LM4]
MKITIQKTALAFLLLTISQISFCQKTGMIKGTISDEKTPLGYVDVILKNLNDSTKVINHKVTDSLGNFMMESIAAGNYGLQFNLIGYKTVCQKVMISESNNFISLGTIVLHSDTNLLNSVVVTSQKKLIQKTAVGFVFNAASNISQTGGTAIDMLKSIPTIVVDADGAISMRGKMPLILINGKNSTITNMDQIAATSIESIEVINNPTAKYDANAESGVINIKLKKNNQSGINGAVALGGGFGAKGRFNSSAILNHKTDKWNFGLSYDNRFAGRTKEIKGSRTNYFIEDEHNIEQNRNDKRTEQLQNLKFNIDFSPNEKNNFSFEAIGNMEGQNNDETLKTLMKRENNNFFSNNTRHSLELERSKVAEFALNYDRKFSDERKSLTASITSSLNRDHENTAIDTYNYNESKDQTGDVFLQRTHNYENGNVSNVIFDYSFPVFEKSIIETGYKGTFRFFNSDFESADNSNGEYIVNPASSNIFKFHEQINAVYGMFNSVIGNAEVSQWKYNLGIRAEQASNDGKIQKNSNSFSNNYLKLFPSASLQYNLKTDEFIKFAYSKRINRPQLGQLNPFVDITDALNPHTGNPFLKPEIINIAEANYNKEWSKYSFSMNAFYRNATNTIKQYSELQDDGSVLLSPKNFGKTITYGLESIFSLKTDGFYDANISLTAFQQNIDGSNVAEDLASKAFNWYGKIINNFVPWSGGKIQIIGNYNSALATPQGERIALYNVDMGFQQKLGSGNARLGLVVTDIFNTLKSGYINNTYNFTNNRTSKSDTRALMVTFAYTFKSAFREKLLENQFTPEY